MGRLLATCGRDKTIWIWKLTNSLRLEITDVCHGHLQDIKFISWHPIRKQMVSSSYDGSVRIWKFLRGSWYCAQILKDPIIPSKSTVWAVIFNKQGSAFASCGDDKKLESGLKTDQIKIV